MLYGSTITERDDLLDDDDITFLAIAKILFVPILSQRPDEWPRLNWIAECLNVETRIIDPYLVTSKFTMPGLRLLSALRGRHDKEKRDIKRGDVLWVRRDLTRPFYIDVSLEQGNCTDDFKVELTEFNRKIFPFIRKKKVVVDMNGETHGKRVSTKDFKSIGEQLQGDLGGTFFDKRGVFDLWYRARQNQYQVNEDGDIKRPSDREKAG